MRPPGKPQRSYGVGCLPRNMELFQYFIRMITPLGIGLILAAYVLIFSRNRKSYIKMARR